MSALNQVGVIGFSFKPISDSSNTVAILEADAGKTDPTKYVLSRSLLSDVCYVYLTWPSLSY